MATETIPAAIGELAVASTAGGGTALTTTLQVVPLLDRTKYLSMYARNYSTAVVAKWAKVPYLVVLKTTDNLATFAAVTDMTGSAQDGSTSTTMTLSSLATLANGGALYVGALRPFRGAIIDVQNTNSTASVLTVKYWNGTAWTTTSATDNTASGGATLAVDGTVTWTLPTDWAKTSLSLAGDAPIVTIPYAFDARFYWTRWEVSVALDSSVTLNSLMALARSAVYAELASGVGWEERVSKQLGGWAGIEALTDAGTANLVILCGGADEDGVG